MGFSDKHPLLGVTPTGGAREGEPVASGGRALTDLEVLVLTEQLRLWHGRGRRALLELERCRVDEKEKLRSPLLRKHDHHRQAPCAAGIWAHRGVRVRRSWIYKARSFHCSQDKLVPGSIYRRREKLRCKHDDLATRPGHTRGIPKGMVRSRPGLPSCSGRIRSPSPRLPWW